MACPLLRLSADRTHLVFAPAGDSPAVPLIANEVDALIADLALMRSRMLPEIATEPPRGQTIRAVRNPRWYAERGQMGWQLFMYRDPGLGWRAIALPPPSAARLGQHMLGRSSGSQAHPHTPSDKLHHH